MTRMDMSSVSKRTPRKTIEVAGGLSLSGEDWRPRSDNKVLRASKAAADLEGISAPPKSSM